jgi:predicted ATPase
MTRLSRRRGGGVYEGSVFLIHPLGFMTVTAARRINDQDSLYLHQVHEAVHRDHGFELVDVPAAPVVKRAVLVEQFITSTARWEESSRCNAV